MAAIKTSARRDGDDYVIDGGKMWITNGTQADWMCCLANTGDPADGIHKNKTLICVPLMEGGKRAKGVTIARKLKKMGMHSSDTAQIFFDGVRVPVANRIGEEGMGFTYQMMQFQEERLYAAVSSVVGCERIIAETIAYTRERRVFGKPLIDNQVIHFRLAELATEVEALRALTWKCVEAHVEGRGCDPAGVDGQAEGRAAEPRGSRCLPPILGRHGAIWTKAASAARFATGGSARSAAARTK